MLIGALVFWILVSMVLAIVAGVRRAKIDKLQLALRNETASSDRRADELSETIASSDAALLEATRQNLTLSRHVDEFRAAVLAAESHAQNVWTFFYESAIEHGAAQDWLMRECERLAGIAGVPIDPRLVEVVTGFRQKFVKKAKASAASSAPSAPEQCSE